MYKNSTIAMHLKCSSHYMCYTKGAAISKSTVLRFKLLVLEFETDCHESVLGQSLE